MKAVVLRAFGSPITVEEIPAPTLGTGEVLVDVVATRVLAYAGEVLSGKRRYLLELPVVPGAGAIGRVRATGPDATRLQVGDWVFCDPTVRSRDGLLSPDITLQGLSAGGPGGLRLQRYFRDGSWAEQMRVPTENAIAIGPIDESTAAKWCALGMLLVPYGGYLAGGVQPGEIVLVNGATGGFGSAGVAAALAMGVRAVVATGRSESALRELAGRFGPRLIPVAMGGDEESDRRRILAAAPGPIDCVLDLLPPAATTKQVRTALLAVRPGGRVVLMGGVGEELSLPYAWLMRNNVTVRGQWMYPPDAVPRMAGMIRAGLVDLDGFTITSFALEDIDAAIAHAAAEAGPFKLTVLELRGRR